MKSGQVLAGGLVVGTVTDFVLMDDLAWPPAGELTIGSAELRGTFTITGMDFGALTVAPQRLSPADLIEPRNRHERRKAARLRRR
jgi:hypothetical protein